MGIDTVSADTHDDTIALRHGLNSVAEPARLFGSARGVVLRIEPEDNIFTGEIG